MEQDVAQAFSFLGSNKRKKANCDMSESRRVGRSATRRPARGPWFPFEIDGTPKRPAEMREIYPGSIPWWAVHPVWTSLLTIMVLAVIALVFQSLFN
jgi:hypothetical protein